MKFVGVAAVLATTALVTCGACAPARSPGSACTPVTYSLNPKISRANADAAFHIWEEGSGHRVCFSESVHPDVIFGVIGNEDDYKTHGFSREYPWGSISGIWAGDDHAIYLIRPFIGSGTEVGVIVHEIGHALGLTHSEHATSYMHHSVEIVDDPLPVEDVMQFCAVRGC